MSPMMRVKALACGCLLFLSSLFGCVCFGGGLLPIFVVRPSLYRHLFDYMLCAWVYLSVALLELVLGMKVVITGDQIRAGERNLILMNHRTRLDWMYFWSVLVRQSGVKSEKIILKAPLKFLPGAGWAMQVGAFIFVQRKWEDDKVILRKMLNYFSDLGHKTQVLLFPEGTDYCDKSKARSDEFAKKNNVKPFEFVLHPRTTGFTYITQLMRQNDHLDAVYDVDIAYPYNFPQTEAELLLGNFPEEVHFKVRRYPIQSLPLTEDGLQTWCKKRWEEKEERLRAFYETRKRMSNGSTPSEEDPADKMGDGLPTATEHATRSSDGGSGGNPPPPARNSKLMLQIALVYWTVFVTGIAVLLWYSSLARWFALFQVCFYLYMGHKRGGFEIFQADYFNWFFNKVKRD